MNKKLLLVGGGGHCRSIIDTLQKGCEYAEFGIVERDSSATKSIYDVQVVGYDSDLKKLFLSGYTHAFISLGSIGDTSVRKKLYSLVKSIGFKIPNIIDYSAQVSAKAQLGQGIFIGKNVMINAGSIVDDCAIINSAAIVEHDCEIGEYVHLAPGVVICGEVKIGCNTHVGANSVIRQQLVVGSDVMIGMGSVVLQNISKNSLAYGNPCKEKK